jgi:hypothetical protein
MTRQPFSYLCRGGWRFASLLVLNIIDASVIGKVIQKPDQLSS